jgi:hypothetical protein
MPYASNKIAAYDKQIESELTIYIAYDVGYGGVRSKERVEFFEEVKKDIIERFSEKGVKADVTILKLGFDYIMSLNIEDIKTNNPNGLTLFLHETANYTYSGGMEGHSTVEVTLTDHLLDKDVWKTNMEWVEYRINRLRGIRKSASIYTNALIRILEKDGLLK